jgi:hypothetical protein
VKKGNLALVLVILAGSIFGKIIGGALSKYVPVLNYGESIGFGPTSIDLNVISFTLGFRASMTVAGIIGIIIALLIYRKVR